MAQESILSMSLKEYKAEIDSLKSSMLGLEKGTQQYNTIAKQAADMQAKLNTVMQDCKNSATAVDGSYNALQSTLSKLRQEWKATGDEAQRDAIGKQMLEINNKLKELDATTGNFQRNVGDYGGAITSVFQNMGVSVGGLDKAFGLASSGATGFKTALDTLKAHPFIAVASAFVVILMKIKDAIGNNEELSKKWSVAMSAFKPILDAISNGMDWLATKLVDVVSWVTDNLPTLLKKIGGFAKSTTSILGKIVDFALFIPKQINKVMTAVVNTVLSGIQSIANGMADIMEYFGADGWAANIRNISEAGVSFMKKMNAMQNDLMQNAGDYIAKVGSGIDSLMNKWSAATTTRMNLAKQENKLNDDIRQREIDNEKSLLKQQELRNQIATASGAEKKKLLGELHDEILKNGKAEQEIAIRTLALAKKQAELAPNSKADNDYLAQLEKNVVKAEATFNGSLVSVNKMLSKTDTEVKKAAESATKEAEKASAEAVKASKEAADGIKQQIQSINDTLKNTLDTKKSQQDLLASMGLATPEQVKEYNTQVYELNKEAIDKRLTLLQESLNNTKLLEAERLNIQNQISRELVNGVVLENQRKAELNKQFIEDTKTQYEEQRQLAAEQQAQQEADDYTAYSKQLEQKTKEYLEGKIKYEEYTQQLNEIKDAYEFEQIQKETANAEEKAEAAKQYWIKLQEQLGENAPSVLAAHQAFLDAQVEAEKQAADQRIAESQRAADAQVKAEDEKNKKLKKVTKATQDIYNAASKAISSILSTVADAEENSIKQKVANGEITEEEAKKEFERVKTLRIVSATIDTIQGAVSAYTAAQSLGPIAGPIVGGINAALVTGMGIYNIAQIKKTQFESGSSSSVSSAASNTSSAAQTASAYVQPLLDENQDMNQMSNMQTANNTSSSGDQRVYIVQEDITNSNKQVEVRESNTTW